MNKKISILLTIIALTLNACGQKATIHGTVTGASGSAIVMNQVNGNKLAPVDTIQIKSDGTYQSDISVAGPTLFVMTFTNIPNVNIHLLAQAKDKITLDLAYLPEFNFMSITSAKGSKDVELYKKFNNCLSQPFTQIEKINEEYALPSTTDQRKSELNELYKQIQQKQTTDIRNLIANNTDCLMSAFLVTYFEQDLDHNLDLYEAVRDGLANKYANNPFYQHVDGIVKSNLRAGSTAPEISMTDPDGKIRKLSDLKGKVVMIDFWASWCRPCRMENPNVVRLYHKYHDAGFEIYSVSLDKDRSSWLKAIQEDGLVWTNHVSELHGWTSSGGAAYGVMSVPSTFLIDRNGKIIAKGLRGEELAKKLQEIFGF